MEMMGRVSSSLMSALSWAQLVGLLLSGSLAQTLSIRLLFFGSAALLVVFVLLGYWRLPQRPVAQPVGPA